MSHSGKTQSQLLWNIFQTSNLKWVNMHKTIQFINLVMVHCFYLRLFKFYVQVLCLDKSSTPIIIQRETQHNNIGWLSFWSWTMAPGKEDFLWVQNWKPLVDSTQSILKGWYSQQYSSTLLWCQHHVCEMPRLAMKIALLITGSEHLNNSAIWLINKVNKSIAKSCRTINFKK